MMRVRSLPASRRRLTVEVNQLKINILSMTLNNLALSSHLPITTETLVVNKS